jgi:DNA-directed RNA polymerase specialized sigma24 family protein
MQSGSNIENEDVLDIKQELLISLWKRLKHYDPEHGNPFSFIQHHMLLTSKYILNHKIKKKIKNDNAVKYAISTYRHSYNPINDLIDLMDFDKFKSSFSKREQSLIDSYVYGTQALKNFSKSERIILKRKLKFKYNL